ncbi:MAG: hypothetical protein WC872_03530 [Candidatus Absconditabacterales bacterium]
MFRKSIKKIFIKLIVGSGFLSLTFFGLSVCAKNYSDLNSYITKISGKFYKFDADNIGNKNLNIKMLIKNYCETLLSVDDKLTYNNSIYNPQQSAFVYLLCLNVDPGTVDDNYKNYFKKYSFQQLGLSSKYDSENDTGKMDSCNPGFMQNDCDIPKLTSKLFNDLINDYVNVKQTSIYGLMFNADKDEDYYKQIDSFSERYFGGLQLCSDKKRGYEKTCKIFIKYLRGVQKNLDNVKILNISLTGIIQNVNSSECSIDNKNYDILACGLFGDKDNSLLSFINLLYNEIFYYRLFVDYYILTAQEYPQILEDTYSRNTLQNQLEKKISQISNQLMRSEKAISLSIKTLRDNYVAFPLHIGFLMYYEDLNGFGNQLVKIVTPMYTLYDKFRNVQEKN